jgi:hypothetical protein
MSTEPTASADLHPVIPTPDEVGDEEFDELKKIVKLEAAIDFSIENKTVTTYKPVAIASGWYWRDPKFHAALGRISEKSIAAGGGAKTAVVCRAGKDGAPTRPGKQFYEMVEKARKRTIKKLPNGEYDPTEAEKAWLNEIAMLGFEDGPIKMRPLAQWICDTCGELIVSIKEGWVEWLCENDLSVHGFRICHHYMHSPIRESDMARGPSCYQYDDEPHRNDLSTDDMTGSSGMARMLSMLDVGPIADPDGEARCRVKDMRNWTETFRRLFIPHFEEARQYFHAAEKDGFFAEANEVWPYTTATLKQVIEKYGRRTK